jgi:hypothetical protein
MNALEARANAAKVNTNSTNSQYSRAIQKIQQAVNGGKYECWFYETMLNDVRVKLTADGYTVDANQNDRDGSLVRISW